MAHAGKKILVKVPGVATAIVGEAMTEDVTTKIYQITDAAKRALQRTGTVRVHKFLADQAAEAGTNTTNIKMTTHGLVAGDLIINHTRAHAKRLVLARVDADNITVSAVTSQTTGDTIEKCPTQLSSLYTLSRLNGKVTYAGAATRVMYISCNYLPLSVAGGAKEFSMSLSADNSDTTIFKTGGADYVLRAQMLKDLSGSLKGLYLDTYYKDSLEDETDWLVEFFLDGGTTYDSRFWAILSSHEASGAVDGIIEYSVEMEGLLDDEDHIIVFD